MIVRQIWVECDQCHTKTPPAATAKTARDQAWKRGWRQVENALGWVMHVCPPCAGQIGLK